MQPIRTQLSQKQKPFHQLLLAFSKYALNLKHFQKKMTLIADFFLNLRTPENVVRYMYKKSRFKGPFDKEDGKRIQTLL